MKETVSKALKRYNYLYGEIDQVYHKMALKLGISDSAMKILYSVSENGGSCLLKEISVFSGLNKQTINSAIRKMEQENLIYLEKAGSKNKMVCFTEEGKLFAEKTALRVIEAENRIFAAWPKEDVENYLKLTETYLLALREETEQL